MMVPLAPEDGKEDSKTEEIEEVKIEESSSIGIAKDFFKRPVHSYLVLLKRHESYHISHRFES